MLGLLLSEVVRYFTIVHVDILLLASTSTSTAMYHMARGHRLWVSQKTLWPAVHGQVRGRYVCQKPHLVWLGVRTCQKPQTRPCVGKHFGMPILQFAAGQREVPGID